MFKIGDYIVYWDKYGSQYPGIILDIHRVYKDPLTSRIKIEINHIKGDRVIWVKPINLTNQVEIIDNELLTEKEIAELTKSLKGNGKRFNELKRKLKNDNKMP